jgi:hypothetical protein
MKVRDVQVITGFMVLAVTLLCGAAFYAWKQPFMDVNAQEIARWQPIEEFTPMSFANQKPQSVLSEALNRPLFRRSRRPFDPASTIPNMPPPEPIQIVSQAPSIDSSLFTVKGIAINNEIRLALIATPESPEGSWMPLETEIMGWKLTEITANGVILSSGDQHQKLKLYVDNGAN